MQNFIDIIFPEYISNESSYNINSKSNINKLLNGSDYRVKIQNTPNLKFLINKTIFTKKMIDEVISFFRITNGSFYSFKFKDPFDNIINEKNFYQEKGENLTKFKIIKYYKINQYEFKRVINFPDLNTLRLQKNNSSNESSILDYKWNEDLKCIEIESPIENDSFLSLYGNFNIIARFENDVLEIQSSKNKNYYTINNLSIIEIINQII